MLDLHLESRCWAGGRFEEAVARKRSEAKDGNLVERFCGHHLNRMAASVWVDERPALDLGVIPSAKVDVRLSFAMLGMRRTVRGLLNCALSGPRTFSSA